ncbi:hypothetical protein [Lentzea xinjiangensis]|uniref:hypothetical protein n=1 Tax=Lentzea xinjiangensis TaxID=402600 RepID=UPI00116089D2|nr:hypothetical protein [Lentzea xinjiangensis]
MLHTDRAIRAPLKVRAQAARAGLRPGSASLIRRRTAVLISSSSSGAAATNFSRVREDPAAQPATAFDRVTPSCAQLRHPAESHHPW